MSAPTTTAPDQAAPPTDEVPESLRQDTRGRPADFGLDVRRLRRTRLIVFAVLALPILALVLLAARFVSLPITQAWQDAAYRDGDHATAIERLDPVKQLNWFEPYLPHLTEGTNLLQQGEDAAAEAELRLALAEWNGGYDLNQPLHAQCKILNNLAVSIERQAVLIEDPGARADRLFEAEELLAPCGGGGGGGGEGGQGGGAGDEDTETTEGNGDRIEEERRKADEEAGNDPDARGTEEQGGAPPELGDPSQTDPDGDGPDEETVTQGPSTDDSKDDELSDRNRDAQGGDGDQEEGGSDEPPAQPW